MEKKSPGFTSRSRANERERPWSTRSSTNCLQGTGLGINLLLALRLPFPALFLPIVFFIPNFARRHTTIRMRSLCAAGKNKKGKKNFGEFRFAVTNASCFLSLSLSLCWRGTFRNRICLSIRDRRIIKAETIVARRDSVQFSKVVF